MFIFFAGVNREITGNTINNNMTYYFSGTITTASYANHFQWPGAIRCIIRTNIGFFKFFFFFKSFGADGKIFANS